ncbi:MAG: hypothetical protein SWX82_15405 [Cyanobacteriota bacterium]|nr:hypothetical protein [Cyanobacteriota bacterium]
MDNSYCSADSRSLCDCNSYYWTIVIALLKSAIRSKCGSLIALFGNSYYWTIVITLLIRDRSIWQFLLLDNSYCSAEERHSEQVRQLNRCI